MTPVDITFTVIFIRKELGYAPHTLRNFHPLLHTEHPKLAQGPVKAQSPQGTLTPQILTEAVSNRKINIIVVLDHMDDADYHVRLRATHFVFVLALLVVGPRG